MVCAALPAFGQGAPATAPAAVTATAPATATIYIYRYKQYIGAALRPSVYCDGVELARIQNGRYVDLQLPPGSHTFYSNDKQVGAVVNLVAGKEYYFRVDLQTGFWKGHFRLEMVEPDQGKYDLSKLKPADKDMIRQVTLPAAQ